jgi:hypothetical protein
VRGIGGTLARRNRETAMKRKSPARLVSPADAC